MLSELAEYAQGHGLAARSGFKDKAVKAYILLSAEGRFMGTEVCPKDHPKVYAPDIGSASQGPRYCNFLIEKAQIPLRIITDEKKDKNIPIKHDFYLSMLEEGGKHEPRFLAVLTALRDEDVRRACAVGLEERRIKPTDPTGFKVDGCPLERSERYLDWWSDFRRMFSKAPTGDMNRCLITGELTEGLATVPKVSGLIAVGGHTSGDAFLCYDKNAFQSYGLEKSANATVSEEAMTSVNAALGCLIEKAPLFGNAKMVHWYSGAVGEQEDLIPLITDGSPFDDEDDEEDEQPDPKESEREAVKSANRLFESLKKGERPDLLKARYYIMPLSGANGRMMVRGWYEGSYETLYRNITAWFDDLRITTPGGKGLTKAPKLSALSLRLLKPGGDPKKKWSRLNDELPNLLGHLFASIVNNTALPDEVAAKTLHWIRSRILASADPEGSTPKDTIQSESHAFQLLKAWLVRKQRQRGASNQMGEILNENYAEVPYCCGRLLAVYGEIQSTANPDVKVGVTERYYTAASTSPAFVISRLQQLSIHHLSKIGDDRPGLAVRYRKLLEQIFMTIGTGKIPTTLSLEQQTEFALGYYQQRAAMYTSKEDSKKRNEQG